MAKTATLEWYSVRDGSKLRLWTAYSDDIAPYGDFHTDSPIVVFRDERTNAFVALETDEPEAVPNYVQELLAEPFAPVDVPQAGLFGVHPAEALLWGLLHLAPHPIAGAAIQTELEAREPVESGSVLDADDPALDRAWERVRREFPNYRATPEQLANLAALPARRAAMYASMPPREERRRHAEELFARAEQRTKPDPE